MINISKLLAASESDKHYISSSSNSKGRLVHKYGPIYDFVFLSQYCKLKRPLRILEIGVATGESLVVWSQFDYVEQVVGIDPGMNPTIKFNNKIHYTKHDGYSADTINFLKETYNGFDIIIDDGPHELIYQKYFFENYFQLLNEGGLMMCEDVYTNNLKDILELKKHFELYVIDLTQNINTDNNEIIVFRFKDNIL